MRVAHFARFVPNLSGQYATVKDLIKAEIQQGIDAGFIAIQSGPGFEGGAGMARQDDWMKTKKMDWAESADIIVRHVSVPSKFVYSGKQPKLMCLHGRPENSFLLGVYSPNDVYNTVFCEKKTWDNFVTFWPEFVFHWTKLLGEESHRLNYVPAMVDLETFSPEGERRDFAENSGSPNIVIADQWREDTTPYNVLHAALYFRDYYCPTAAIHVYGIRKHRAMLNLVRRLRGPGYLGQTKGACNRMEQTFRAADIVVTPHVIATRIIRETMACGTPLVAGGGCSYTSYNADPRNTELSAGEINKCWQDIKTNPQLGKDFRIRAEKEFSLEQTGKAMVKLFERMLDERAKKPEIDISVAKRENSRAERRRQEKKKLKQLQQKNMQQIKQFYKQRAIAGKGR